MGRMALCELPADRGMDRLSSVQVIREVDDIGNKVNGPVNGSRLRESPIRRKK